MNGPGSTPNPVRLASGLALADPLDRLLAFCAAEYAYYDAIPSSRPNRIDPIDILATVSMNSFVNSAGRVRSVHQGLAAACEPILADIPVDADLRTFDLGPLQRLLDAACRVRSVLVPVATKVLHRKRRSLIPMLDGVVIGYYRRVGVRVSAAALQDGARAAGAVMPVLEAFRADLASAWDRLTQVTLRLAGSGYQLTPLRALELLIWTETEPRGYYRG
jgi:Family of unknown function (DUF6308)